MKKFLVFILSVTLGASLGAATDRFAEAARVKVSKLSDDNLTALLTVLEPVLIEAKLTDAMIDGMWQRLDIGRQKYNREFLQAANNFTYHFSRPERGGDPRYAEASTITATDYDTSRGKLQEIATILYSELTNNRSERLSSFLKKLQRRSGARGPAALMPVEDKEATRLAVEAERKRLAEEVAAAEQAQRLAIQAEAEVPAQRAQEAAEAEQKRLAGEAAAAEEARKAQETLRALEVEKARKLEELKKTEAERAAATERRNDALRKILERAHERDQKNLRSRLYRWVSAAAQEGTVAIRKRNAADAYRHNNLMRKALGGWKTYLDTQRRAQYGVALHARHQLSSAFKAWRVLANKHGRREAAIAWLRGLHDKKLLRDYFHALASHAWKKRPRTRAYYKIRRIADQSLLTAVFKRWKENIDQPLQDALAGYDAVEAAETPVADALAGYDIIEAADGLSAQASEPADVGRVSSAKILSALQAAYDVYKANGDCQGYNVSEIEGALCAARDEHEQSGDTENYLDTLYKIAAQCGQHTEARGRVLEIIQPLALEQQKVMHQKRKVIEALSAHVAERRWQRARLAGLNALARDLQLKDAFSRWKLAAAEKPIEHEAVHPDVQAVLDDILLNIPVDAPGAEARNVIAAPQQQLVAPVQEVPLLVALPVVHERPALPAHLGPITEEVPGGSVTTSGQSALSQSQSPALSDAPSSQSASPTPDQGGSGPLVLDDVTEKKSGVMPDERSSKNDYSTWLLGSGAGLTLAGAALLMGQQTPKGRLNALTDALRSNSQLTPRQKARILGGLLTLAAGVTVGAVGAYQKLD